MATLNGRGGRRAAMRFLDPLPIEEVKVIQQGRVFKLKAKGVDGQPLWA